ncbi:hypothetical protein ACYSNX_09150 [Myroides sp. LJL115]
MAFSKTNYQVSSSLLLGISLLILFGYYVLNIYLSTYNSQQIKGAATLVNPLIKGLYILKISAGLFLVLSVYSTQVRKDYQGKPIWLIVAAIGGIFVYCLSELYVFLGIYPIKHSHWLTLIGYLIVGYSLLLSRRVLKQSIDNDVFNTFNESFLQQERKIVSKDSLNIPTHYFYKGKRRAG